MTTHFRGLLAATLLCCGALAAKADGLVTIDSGRFIVLQGNQPIAIERFEYVQSGDSLVISAVVERKARDASGAEVRFDKTSQTIVGASDFGIRSYLSNQAFDGHNTIKTIAPSDTGLIISTEVDGAGDMVQLVRPPGRVFVMDPLVFTLFDIICRSVAPQTFTKRPIQLVTLAPTNTTTDATIATAGADTVRWGGKRVIARRFVMTDPSSRFTVWMDPKGRMLRLEHDGSGLAVIREEPESPKPKKKAASAK